MAKFYNVRVIEADNLRDAQIALSNGEADFIETDTLSDVILPFDDLAEKIANEYK